MTNKDIENKTVEVLQKYVKRGGVYKVFDDIMQSENIKYREIDVPQDKFLGALTTAIDGTVCIVVNENIENEGRKNFTIAHELGHFFLQHQLTSNSLYCAANDISENDLSKSPIEREANYFATCLLMPEDKVKNAFLAMLKRSRRAKIKDFLYVKNDFTFGIWKGICDDLTKRYGVSESALRYRLEKLGIARFEFV